MNAGDYKVIKTYVASNGCEYNTLAEVRVAQASINFVAYYNSLHINNVLHNRVVLSTTSDPQPMSAYDVMQWIIANAEQVSLLVDEVRSNLKLEDAEAVAADIRRVEESK